MLITAILAVANFADFYSNECFVLEVIVIEIATIVFLCDNIGWHSDNCENCSDCGHSKSLRIATN